MADPVQTISFNADDVPDTILNTVLAGFSKFIDAGGDRVVESFGKAAAALLAFQMLKFLLDFGFRPGNVAKATVTFLTAIGWYQLAMNAVPVTDAYIKWMSAFGSYLTGGYIDENIMQNPDKIMTLGMKTAGALQDAASQLSIWSDAAVLLLAFGVVIALIFTFLLMGGVVVIVVIRAKLNVMLGLAFIPFAIERELSGFAWRGIGMIMEAGINLAATSMVISIGYGFLKEITLSPTPTLREGLCLAMSALVIGVMAFGALMKASIGLRQ